MDIATIIGIVGGFGMLFGAILLEGSSPMSFVNLLATVVVVGGGSMAVLARQTMIDLARLGQGAAISVVIFIILAVFVVAYTRFVRVEE